MAEFLAAIGGVAASAQLLHYGFQVLTAASALPRYIRHSPDMMQAWMKQSSAMLQMAQDVKQQVGNIDASTELLVDICMKDAIALRSLLVPTRSGKQKPGRSRPGEIWFVLRKEHEIERIITAFKNTFTLMAAKMIMSTSIMTEQRHAGVTEGRSRNLRQLERTNNERGSTSAMIRDLLSIMSFFGSRPIPLGLLSQIAAPEKLADALDTLVATMCVSLEAGRTLVQLNRKIRAQMRSELQKSSDGVEYLTVALDVLDCNLPGSFTRVDTLSRGRDLHPHVISALQATMRYSTTHTMCSQAAYMASRVCEYLLADGKYKMASQFMSAFQVWCEQQYPNDVCMATGLEGKKCAALALQGDLAKALSICNGIVRSRHDLFGSQDKRTLHSLNNKGLIHHERGESVKALACHKRAYQGKMELFGNDHPDTLVSANNMGIAYQSQGRHSLAERLYRRSLVGWLQAYGKEDTDIISARSNLAIALQCQGRLDEAISQHRYVYRKRCEILTVKHPETVKSKANIAITLNAMRQHSEAEKLYREALDDFTGSLGPSHPDVLKTHTNLATALHDQGKHSEAEAIVRNVLPLIIAKHGSTHFSTLMALEFHAILLHHMQNFIAALAVATELVRWRSESFGYHHVDTKRSVRHMRDLRLATA